MRLAKRGIRMLPDVIFLGGRMGSGKSHIARVLERDGYTVVAFADALKNDLAQELGITRAEFDLRKGEFRTQMQELGERKRAEYRDFWIARWVALANEKFEAGALGIVVPDMRYINEARWALNLGAMVVRVSVPREVRCARLEELYGTVTEEQLTHASETQVELLPVHVEISGQLPDYAIIKKLKDEWRHLVRTGVATVPRTGGSWSRR